MKRILADPKGWPRHQTEAIATREKDLVVRIADWTKDRDEPAYDVEVYIGGVYDWNESKTFSLREYQSKSAAKNAASRYAADQIAKLL